MSVEPKGAKDAELWCRGLTCLPVTQETAGSNPVSSAIKLATVAQSVEQRTENPRVGGSIPSRGTIKKRAEVAQW